MRPHLLVVRGNRISVVVKALRTDLDRFTFLLGGTDGEDLFGQC